MKRTVSVKETSLRDHYRKGDKVELTISDIAEKDQCFGRLENGTGVFVRGMLAVNDSVRAVIRKVRAAYLEALLEEVLFPSPDRVEPECPVFGVCGGCKWMHVRYDAQLRYKKKKVQDALVHLGGVQDVHVKPVHHAPAITHYRNKVEFSCSSKRYLLPDELTQTVLDKSKNFAIGFHAPGNFEKVLDIETCYLAKGCMNRALTATRQFALDHSMSPYAARDHEGYLRNLALRYSEEDDMLMVNLVTSWHDASLMETYREHMLASMGGQPMTIVNNVTTRKNTVAVGEEEYAVHGDGVIQERLGELVFRISANSFFQTNTRQTEALYSGILEMAGLQPDDTVYDLYCGTGTITLYLAGQCRHAVGIEVVESSLDDAADNARSNGIGNVSFYKADLKNFHSLLETLEAYGFPRVIVTDPPRAGMHPKALTTMVRLQPETIVYVSCNPANLARDSKDILAAGYSLTEVQPFDMFPHTSHIETLACFRRKA